VRLLRSVLKEHRISAGDDQAPCTALALLATLVAAAAEFGARRLASRPARPSDLVSGPSHDEPWHGEVKEWARRLGRLRLGEAQREAILEMRAAQMARLRVVCEERCRLNEKARSLLGASSDPPQALSEHLRSVWDRVKSNVRLERRIAADGMRRLLMDILDPVRGALLLLEAHPGGVDPIKVADALAAADRQRGGWATDAMSSAADSTR
ncbi:unnamed protein product, partial [Ostreobium quekettii]